MKKITLFKYICVLCIYVAVLSIATFGHAQSPNDGFNPNANGTVNAIALQSDGKILVGGAFTTISGVTRNRIARLHPNGSLDTTFTVGTGANNTINAVAVQSDNKIIIGGTFTSINGTLRNRIARLNSNGSLDTGFNPNANSAVYTIALQSDGKMLLGGAFTNISGVSHASIVRLNSNGSRDTSFNASAGGTVWFITVQPDGKILLGGDFTAVNGTTRNFIARLNSSGSLDTGFAPNPDSSVYSMAVQPDGMIVIGGTFTGIDGTTRNNIARLYSDGSLDSTFNPDADNYVNSVVVQPDGKILMGGNFTWLNNTSIARSYIARLNSNGSVDTTFNPYTNNFVMCVAVQSDGKIIAGGTFTAVRGVARNRIARLYPSGSLDTALNVKLNGIGYAIAVQPNGKIVIGGTFTTISSTLKYSRRLARVSEDGIIESGFNPDPNNDIRGSIIQPDGKIIIIGKFTTVGGVTRKYIARLNSDGSLDTGFNPNVSGIVWASALQPDGKIVIGGDITDIDGYTRNRIARLNSDGTLDADFNPNANGSVFAIAVQPDGKIVIGGNFTTVGGTTRNNIARLDGSNGSLDTTFNPNANDYVYAIALQPDGRILIGGAFTMIDGFIHYRIARLDSTGSLDTTFNPYTNSSVESIALQLDGKILIGGGFGTVNGIVRLFIARLNSNGSLEETFNSYAGNTIASVAIQPDGKILVGGGFTAIGGVSRSGFARLTNTGAVMQDVEVTVGSSGNAVVSWMRSGAGPEFSRVWFEKSIDGTTWTLLGNGTRITGGWELTGVSVSYDTNTYFRARGVACGSSENSSASLLESVKLYYFPGRTLSISRSGSGTGTVTSVPTGINCGADCSEKYVSGTQVTLTATPSTPDARFRAWSASSCPSTGDCVVTMDADMALTATFDIAISIQNGDALTSLTSVSVNLNNPTATKMRFMINNSTWTAWEVYNTTKKVTLPTGDGTKTVYVQFDNDETIYSDTILLDTKVPVGKILIDAGAYATISLGVTVTLFAADDSDITEMCVSTTTTCTAWEPFAATKAVTLPGTMGVFGTKTVYAKFKDRGGKISAQVSDTIAYVSGIDGYTGSNITIDSGEAYARKTAVGLTLTRPNDTYTLMKFSNDGTTWTAYGPYYSTKSYTLPAGDGPRTVYVKFKTAAGVEAGPYADEIILDTKPPVGAILINNGAISTNSADVTLQLEASDMNGVDQMQFSTDGINWSVAESYATTKSLTLSAGDGTKKVSVKFIDDAGNTSTAVYDTILLDTTPPVGKVVINGGALTTTNPLVKLTLAAPGAVTMQICTDGATWGSWEPFVTAKEVTIPNTAGSKTVSVKFRDYTGNESTASDTIDMVLPPSHTSDGTISIRGVGTGSAYTTTTVVTVDIVTGTYTHMQFSTNNTTWSAWEGINPTKTITLPTGDGVKYVLAKFKDAVNEYGPFGDTIILDTKAPTGAIVINGNAAFSNISTVTVSVNAFDANGVAAMNFSLNGITWLGWETYATTKTLTLHAPDGTKKVSVKFKDNAGKESAVIYDSITLDRVAPVGKVVINGGAAETSSDIVTLTLTATGATMMQISLDGGSTWDSWETYATSKKVTLPVGPGDKVVKVKFRDAAGNESALPAEDSINRS